MNFVVKLNDRYLAQPKDDTWNADTTNWTIDINEARIGSFKEMTTLAQKIDRPGLLQVVRVNLTEV